MNNQSVYLKRLMKVDKALHSLHLKKKNDQITNRNERERALLLLSRTVKG